MMPYSRLRFFLFAQFLIIMCIMMLLTPLHSSAASVAGPQASHLVPHLFLKPGVPLSKARIQAASSNLSYRGGPVMTGTTKVYIVLWEPGNNVSSNYNSLLQRYFNDVGGSSLYQIANPYVQSNGGFASNARLTGSWIDTSAYPQSPLLDSNIQQEVTHAQQVNGWQPNINTIFFVFTGRGQNLCIDSSQSQCASNSFCAYHSFFGNNTIYAAMPYDASFSCNPGSSPNHDDVDQTINIASHEQIEAATDPLLNAWLDSSGAEIGDKCVWQFGPRDAAGSDVVWNNHEYIAQQEWDNNTSSCRLTASTGLSSLAGTWSQCAAEGGTCAFSGAMTVAYGANGRYFYRTISNGATCSNTLFGDPNAGNPKACYQEPVPPTSNVWKPCAAEGGICAFNGTMTVAYGANGQFNYATLSNGATCSNTLFGDPSPSNAKTCSLIAAPPNTISWTLCASESATCTFSGPMTIAYGASGQFNYVTLSDSAACGNSTFGDPSPGNPKNCYYN